VADRTDAGPDRPWRAAAVVPVQDDAHLRRHAADPPGESALKAAERIDAYIAEVSGWRGRVLARLRQWIGDAAPELVETWKWNTPVWTRNGNVVACGAFRDHVKINFFDGASLADPKRLFNAGLEAKKSRAIDLHEGDVVDEAAFKALVRAAATLRARKR
jgi:hypothetical protein